jgi:hypothetical protein
MPSLGFQCLLLATLVMAVMQIVSLVGMYVFGREIKRSVARGDHEEASLGAWGQTPSDLGQPLMHEQDV